MSTTRSKALVIALCVSTLAPLAHATPEVWARSYALEAQSNARGALEALEAMPAAERAGYLFTLRRAWLLYLVGRFDEAVAGYRAATMLAPNAVEPQVGELLPLIALRRWQEVEQRARAVLRLDADNYLASRRLGLALYNLGRFDDAEAVYRGVFGRYPSDLEMLAGIGWCDVRRGRRVEAATSFRAVLAVSAEDATARAGLAAASAP